MNVNVSGQAGFISGKYAINARTCRICSF